MPTSAYKLMQPGGRASGGARRPPSAWSRRLVAVALVTLGLAVVAGWLFYASLPSVADARARVGAIQARTDARWVWVSRNARVARAIVAVEDERFYEHGAVDQISLARALRTSLTGSVDPGGSTITQQLAKVLYLAHPQTLTGRLRAIGLAVKLEHRFSKAQILNMYLNAIYYGHGFYGVEAASQGYFGRRANGLSWGQAALLAGLPQSPSALDPLRHPARARTRQREVLAQLVDNRAISRAAANRLGHMGLPLATRLAR